VSSDLGRPTWAQISRDLSWPEAEWQLSGNRKRKRTFDGWSQLAQFDRCCRKSAGRRSRTL